MRNVLNARSPPGCIDELIAETNRTQFPTSYKFRECVLGSLPASACAQNPLGEVKAFCPEKQFCDTHKLKL